MKGIDRIKLSKLKSKLAKESKSAKSVGEMEVPSMKIQEEVEIEAPASTIKSLDLPIRGIKKIDTSVPIADKIKSMEVKGMKKPMMEEEDDEVYDVDVEGPIGAEKNTPVLDYLKEKKKRGM